MAQPEPREVQVAYALPDRQRIVILPHRDRMTAMEAVVESRLLEEFPPLRERPLALGIFGQVVDGSRRLEPGDRVEIYRPLKADPRETRRRLAAQGRTMGRSGSGR
ncbi:MAG: RnfH family protein [Steroidobacteraceae bacterium]